MLIQPNIGWILGFRIQLTTSNHTAPEKDVCTVNFMATCTYCIYINIGVNIILNDPPLCQSEMHAQHLHVYTAYILHNTITMVHSPIVLCLGALLTRVTQPIYSCYSMKMSEWLFLLSDSEDHVEVEAWMYNKSPESKMGNIVLWTNLNLPAKGKHLIKR